jgi:hypothetical protein
VEASAKHFLDVPRVTIRRLLEDFRDTVEAEAVGSFWESRAKGKLKKRPEQLGQEILAVFASAKLSNRGAVIREAVSGTGYVDVLLTFSSGLLHVVELKMLKGGALPGPAQLSTYMKHKHRNEGWLVFFDVRKGNLKKPIPQIIKRRSGIIRTILIDVNPIAPSKRKEAA